MFNIAKPFVDFSKAFIVSCRLGKNDTESTKEWSIRVVSEIEKVISPKVKEKSCNVFGYNIIHYMEYVVYLWMTIAKIAESKSVNSIKYWQVHKRVKIMNDRIHNPLYLCFATQQEFKKIWDVYEIGLVIIKEYIASDKLIDFDKSILDKPFLGF